MATTKKSKKRDPFEPISLVKIKGTNYYIQGEGYDVIKPSKPSQVQNIEKDCKAEIDAALKEAERKCIEKHAILEEKIKAQDKQIRDLKLEIIQRKPTEIKPDEEELERLRIEKLKKSVETRAKVPLPPAILKAQQETAARLAKEKAQQETAARLAKEKADQETAARLAKEKADQETAARLAKEKADKETAARIAKEKADQETAREAKAEREKAAALQEAEEDWRGKQTKPQQRRNLGEEEEEGAAPSFRNIAQNVKPQPQQKNKAQFQSRLTKPQISHAERIKQAREKSEAEKKRMSMFGGTRKKIKNKINKKNIKHKKTKRWLKIVKKITKRNNKRAKYTRRHKR